ncbi:TetR family transcriptional regulator [Oxalobacteraceae bacterium R-40]|uniref:TetR family transcriptional regulator n=1 Tax=Keguizhuia sedimenti TaxID=3064264 RepID=A0ABU1BTD1_9BURK|nr:TetR family transcriptional regulator [Oxalobacteraceae bacterium R-40]
MPTKKSSNTEDSSFLAGRANLQEGRINQKQRTYQALLDAALDLADMGRQPTLQEVAGKAGVSRATAYRYFSSADAMIREAYFGRAAIPLEEFVPPGTEPIEAIGRAAKVMNSLLLKDEAGIHIVERAFMQAWLDKPAEDSFLRMGRRMNYIDPILDSLSGHLNKAARKRLRTVLSMVIGTEAVLAMRDVAGASEEESIAAGMWAAQALLRQALMEAQADEEKAKGKRSGGRR